MAMHQMSHGAKRARAKRKRARLARRAGRTLSVDVFDALIDPEGRGTIAERRRDAVRKRRCDTIRKRRCHVEIDMHGATRITCVKTLRRKLLGIDRTDCPLVGVITGKGLHSKNGMRVIHDPVHSLLEGWGCQPDEVDDGFVFTLTEASRKTLTEASRKSGCVPR